MPPQTQSPTATAPQAAPQATPETFTNPFGGTAETASVPLEPPRTMPARRQSEMYILRSEAAKNIAMQNRTTEDDEDDF